MLTLETNTIDLWLIDASVSVSDQDMNLYQQWLNDAERQRRARFVFAKDRDQYTVARALLRSTLSVYHQTTEPHEWQFDFGPHGKPFVTNLDARHIQFNLSHTDGLIALAVRDSLPIGVDVERITRANDLPSLARHCFTENEQNCIFANEEARLRERFFYFWTLKEALIKAVGKGLTMGLKTFEFNMANGEITVSGLKPEHGNQWQFKQWQHSSEHALALAAPMQESGSPMNVRTYLAHPAHPFKLLTQQ